MSPQKVRVIRYTLDRMGEHWDRIIVPEFIYRGEMCRPGQLGANIIQKISKQAKTGPTLPTAAELFSWRTAIHLFSYMTSL
jgi:hypothetical protein